MINSLENTQKHIVNWIKTYADNAGIKTLVVGLSGGVDSALVALLCKETGIDTICVNMPCNSSGSAFERASNFAKEQGLRLLKIDLTNAHKHIIDEYSNNKLYSAITEEALGGLSSCLRAPTLSFLALTTKGIIVGTGNRSEDNLIRYFQKFGDGCVDMSPIADLFKSEVYELFAYMADISNNPAAKAIHDATPTADLWGPDAGHEDESELGMSYDEIEWGDRENMKNGIIINDEDPVKHSAWLGYSLRQREVIAKMHQLEKISRHKYNSNLPVCELRNIDGLVR